MNAPIDKKALKEITNIAGNKCFLCGSENPHGLYMKFFTDEEKGYSKVVIPEYLSGWNNVVHGGIVTAVLDEIACWTAHYLAEKLVLTKTITVNFLKPLFTGEEITATGEIIEQKGDKEIIMKSTIHNSKGKLCAEAKATIAMFTFEQGTKLNFLDSNSITEAEKNLKKLDTTF